jgi:hypothetical protein
MHGLHLSYMAELREISSINHDKLLQQQVETINLKEKCKIHYRSHILLPP